MCLIDSLFCTAETNTTLQSNYSSVKFYKDSSNDNKYDFVNFVNRL